MTFKHLSFFTCSTCPTAPTELTTTDTTSESWTGTWNEINPAAVPVETYTIKCVANGEPCSGAAVGTADPASVPRGGQYQAIISGLSPSTTYNCYAVAENELGTACSDAVEVTSSPAKCGEGPSCSAGSLCCDNGSGLTCVVEDNENCGENCADCGPFVTGYRCCNGGCTNILYDPANCGACGNICSNCSNGQCQ